MTPSFMRVEDLEVYQLLCRLHIDVCDLTHTWPSEERYELGSQARRSSNSSPAQLAEKNDDRHVRNKIEGVNRARGEAAETIHHLYIAQLKNYITEEVLGTYRDRYGQCIRMLNGLERTLEAKIPEDDRRWVLRETSPGWPASPTPDTHLPRRSPAKAGRPLHPPS